MALLEDDNEQLDRIAEYADASLRTTPRRGSLAAFPGRKGLNLWLYRRWGNNGNAIYTATGATITIALMGLWAWLLKEPLVFPSLGATAFLFFETPLAEVASVRNTVIGHGVACVAGYLALLITGLTDHPSVLVEGVEPARIAAVAIALGTTGGVLRVLRAAHPPAGATTIIVSAGLLHTPSQIAAIAGGVLLLATAAVGLNRLLGVPAPLWRA